MTHEKRVPSKSARELNALLKSNGEEAAAIRVAVHRTMLWQFTTFRRRPNPDTIAELHRLSRGKVAADGWESDKRAALRAVETNDSDDAPPESGDVDCSEDEGPRSAAGGA